MDVTPLVPEGRKMIQRYGGGKFIVNDDIFTSPIIIMPERVLDWSGQEDQDFELLYQQIEIHQNDIEVILFGLGEEVTSLLPQRLKDKLRALGINSDIMNTGAACRTYNVLLTEGRRVAAALLPVA